MCRASSLCPLVPSDRPIELSESCCSTASAHADRKGLQKMTWSVIDLSLVCIQLFSSEGKAEECRFGSGLFFLVPFNDQLSVSSMHGFFMNTHSVRQRVVYFSLCLFWKQPPLGWQLIAERVKGAFAWSGQPSSRSYPDWKASRWKATCTFIPANIRQGVSEDKEIWKKRGKW